jgi:hypothetical protein
MDFVHISISVADIFILFFESQAFNYGTSVLSEGNVRQLFRPAGFVGNNLKRRNESNATRPMQGGSTILISYIMLIFFIRPPWLD